VDGSGIIRGTLGAIGGYNRKLGEGGVTKTFQGTEVKGQNIAPGIETREKGNSPQKITKNIKCNSGLGLPEWRGQKPVYRWKNGTFPL